ncbi:MAG: hypothetical protein MZV70_66130 [Desulfobacterales bacterium]|nr:hypothetical protein [Desulfobacterales bacterium]
MKVTVYGHQDLTTVARVNGDRPHQSATTPGAVNVSGLTTSRIAQKVTEHLADRPHRRPERAGLRRRIQEQKDDHRRDRQL